MKPELLTSVRLSNQSVRLMGAVLREHGIDPRPLVTKAGLPVDTLDNVAGEVTGVQELHFQNEFARATQARPDLWFTTGGLYRLMAYGPLGLAVLAAGTIHAGLKVLVSFQALTFSLLQYRIVEEDGALIGLEADDAWVDPEMRDFTLVRALGSATMFLRDMRQPFPLETIETRLQRRDYGMDFEAALGVPVHFGAPRSRWLFLPGSGDLPLPMANPLLEQTYQQLCERLIRDAEVQDDFVAQVYGLLVRATRMYPSADEVARQLSMSERTLNRRLARLGLHFGELLDQVRRQRATYMLDRSALSIDAIGEMLGFAETSSFSRAFKKWTGSSPMQYRQRPR